MTVIFISAFAVAFLLALLDEVIEFINIFLPPKVVNAFFSIGFSSLALLLLGADSTTYLIIQTLAVSFLARVFLTTAERIATYRPVSIKPYQ